MDEYFKAYCSWYAAISVLSDSEAGRLAKAVWKYACTGEDTALVGPERAIYALIKQSIDQGTFQEER